MKNKITNSQTSNNPDTEQSATNASEVFRSEEKRLNVEEFVLRAIEALASPGKQTIHTVYTGFNEGFRKYFPDLDPIKETEKLVEAGKISFRFCRGGALIGKPGAITRQDSSKQVLRKMGLKE